MFTWRNICNKFIRKFWLSIFINISRYVFCYESNVFICKQFVILCFPAKISDRYCIVYKHFTGSRIISCPVVIRILNFNCINQKIAYTMSLPRNDNMSVITVDFIIKQIRVIIFNFYSILNLIITERFI